MFNRTLTIAGTLLALTSAHAADPAACSTTLQRLSDERELATLAADDPDAIVFETGEFDADFGSAPQASMSGGVVLRQGDKAAGAERAQFDPTERALLMDGNVRYEDPGTVISADTAEFAYDLGRIRFEGAEFSLGASNARGAASMLEINEEGRLELDDVSYTTCPPGSDDWLLQADDIDLDTRAGVGTAKNIKLRFQGVPILYAPYLSFPIGDARKSGLLTPEIGRGTRNGNEILIPYYWNIAPNYDATITPRLLTDRGTQLKTEFRYLTTTMNGQVQAEYIARDTVFDASRNLVRVDHRTLLPRNWRNRIDFRQVSDSQYFEDLGGSLSLASVTHLNRSLSIDWHAQSMSFLGRVQDYQTIDDALTPVERPYRRLPQLLFNGSWPDHWLGLDYGVNGELVNFDRDVGVTGWRLNLAPAVEIPFGRPGWFVKPAAALDYTRYALDNQGADGPRSPSRTLPIGSLDAGLILERELNGRIQTLEPRLLYAHIPYREQSDLPVFDTITPDLNLVQLYRKNRFLGIDRIADTDQVSIGVTSRLLDLSSGKELLSATVGQTRYLSQSGVLLPGEDFTASESSDYIAEVRFLVYDNLNFDVGHQWATSDQGATRSEARLQYRPAGNKVLNLAYRFRRDSLEQGDVSWSWPISSSWNVVGRYNFSFRDEKALEQFFGLEYESCCWGLRLVSRRYISTRNGTADSSFGLQLVLKGMTSVGTAADKLLERGILGYSANLR